MVLREFHSKAFARVFGREPDAKREMTASEALT
jgi:hypothetical protein